MNSTHNQRLNYKIEPTKLSQNPKIQKKSKKSSVFKKKFYLCKIK